MKEKTVSKPAPAPPASVVQSSVIQPGNTDEKKVLADLLALPYQSFSVDQIIACEKEYGLNHFHYVDVVLRRIISKATMLSPRDVMRLWLSIRQAELEYWFLCYIPDTIEEAHKKVDYGIPETELENPEKLEEEGAYPKLLSVAFNLEDPPNKQRKALFNGKFITLRDRCSRCGEHFYVRIRLKDSHPCYELSIVSTKDPKDDIHVIPIQHCYLDIAIDEHEVGSPDPHLTYPLSTYSRAEVVTKMKELLADTKTKSETYLSCHVKCSKLVALDMVRKRTASSSSSSDRSAQSPPRHPTHSTSFRINGLQLC